MVLAEGRSGALRHDGFELLTLRRGTIGSAAAHTPKDEAGEGETEFGLDSHAAKKRQNETTDSNENGPREIPRAVSIQRFQEPRQINYWTMNFFVIRMPSATNVYV